MVGGPAVMYTSASVQLAPMPSATHASLTSLKLIRGWLDDHVPKARMKASWISSQFTNVAPKVAILPDTLCDSSLKVGSRFSHRCGSSANVMPLPRPALSCGVGKNSQATLRGRGQGRAAGGGAARLGVLRQRPREVVRDVGAAGVEDPAEPGAAPKGSQYHFGRAVMARLVVCPSWGLRQWQDVTEDAPSMRARGLGVGEYCEEERPCRHPEDAAAEAGEAILHVAHRRRPLRAGDRPLGALGDAREVLRPKPPRLATAVRKSIV